MEAGGYTENEILVIFDGLDEAGSNCPAVLAFLREWMHQRHLLQRRDVVVVTSRPQQLSALVRLSLWWQCFRTYDLESLSLADAEELLEKKLPPGIRVVESCTWNGYEPLQTGSYV